MLQLHHFLNPFSQLPTVKKDLKTGAARKISGPSYLVKALDGYIIIMTKIPSGEDWKDSQSYAA